MGAFEQVWRQTTPVASKANAGLLVNDVPLIADDLPPALGDQTYNNTWGDASHLCACWAHTVNGEPSGPLAGGTCAGPRFIPMDGGAGAAHFGVQVAEFIGHSANSHWLVRRGTTEMVLRRFRPIRSLAYAEYEATVLARLAALGHPVPTVVDEPAEVDGFIWFLMTKAEGTPGGYETDDPRERGRQLAALHDGLGHLTDLGQREGRQLTYEPIVSATLDAALVAYAAWFPSDARVLQWHLERCRASLDEHDVTSLPSGIIHGDFTPWNLLFTDGALTGIVDFDLSHWDLRIADFALSWRGKYDDVVFGFDEVSPLSDLEWELLTPIRWAWLLSFVEDGIDEMRSGASEPWRFDWELSQMLRRSPEIERHVTPYTS